MAQKTNIVTFEEARRSAKRRAGADSGALTTKLEQDKPSARKRMQTRTRDGAPSGPAAGAKAPKAAARSQAKEAAKRQRAKVRADKKFDKLYGGSGGAAPAEGGPRAAVYAAKMGAKHRKAAHALKQKASDGLSAASGFIGGLTLPDLKKLPKRTMRILTVIGCAAFLTFMLYAPAQNWYHQTRERDRVAAEYEAVLDRNQALADSVDALQSDAGIEDKAHAEYGMVKEGEAAGSVSGLDVEGSTDFVANVIPGGVPAPETWYSGVLDVLFGYANPDPNQTS